MKIRDLFDKVVNKLGYQKAPKEVSRKKKMVILPWETVPEATTYTPLLNEMPPTLKEEDYLKSATSWVYACLSAICDEVATINLRLYQRTKKGVEELTEHPLLDLLSRVNDFTTKFDHIWLTQEYLELAGEAPWLLDRSGDNNQPVAMYLLRPDKLTIKFEKEKVIGGYKYQVGAGKIVTFEPEEVIFLKYPNPLKPFRGRGTLLAAAQTIDLDKYAEQWNVQFFFNAARPDALLITKQKLTDAQIDSLKKQWKKEFQGIGKRAKLAILEGELDYKQLQLSQKDMDFIEQQKFSRDKILSIFRVPKPVVAITEDVNRANAEAGAYAFARWTIRPKMTKIVEQLNEFLVPMFGDDLYLDFDDPVPQNVEMLMKKYANALKSGWMTINEVREEEGMKPVSGGDEIYLPMNLVSVGSTEGTKAVKKIPQKMLIKTKPKVEEKEVKEAIKDVIKAHLIKKTNRVKPEKKEVSKKEKFWRAQIKVQEKLEKRFIDKLRILFENQRRETIRKLTKKAINIPSILLNVESESKTFVITLTPIVREVIKQEGDIALSIVGVDETMDMAAPAVVSFLRKNPIKFSKEVNKVTNEKIRKQLEIGIREGEGIGQMAKRVNGVFGECKTSRAMKIARTETARSMGFATEEAYIQSEVVKGKEWLTAMDERTCEICSAMNGKTMALGENFFDKGDTFMGTTFDYDSVQYPPIHPLCRCTLIPVIGTRSIKVEVNKEEIEREKEKAVKEVKAEIEKEKEKELKEIREKRDKISKVLEEDESGKETKIEEGKRGTG